MVGILRIITKGEDCNTPYQKVCVEGVGGKSLEASCPQLLVLNKGVFVAASWAGPQQ